MDSPRPGVVTINSRYARRASTVWGIPNLANRLLHVGKLSSMASRPLSSATIALAVSIRSCGFIFDTSVCLLVANRPRRRRVSPVTPFNALPSEGALDQSGQLTCSAVDSLDHGCFLVSDRDGLAAFEAGFHYAALVVLAGLVGALVAQVDL